MPKATLQIVRAPSPQLLTAADSKRLGAELTALYHDAVAGHLRVLAFGAKFLEVEERVTIVTRSGSHDTKGQGMKAWLAEHCPDIARSTAYKFRDIAAAVADKFRVKDPALVFAGDAAALPAPVRRQREKVMAYMADKSLRGLQLELGLGAAHRAPSGGNLGGRRKKKHQAPPQAQLEEIAAEAVRWHQSEVLIWRSYWLEARAYRHLPDIATADGELTLSDFRELLATTLQGVDTELKARRKGGREG